MKNAHKAEILNFIASYFGIPEKDISMNKKASAYSRSLFDVLLLPFEIEDRFNIAFTDEEYFSLKRIRDIIRITLTKM